MKVKDILKILEVVEKLPADMYDIVEDSNYDGAYYSDSQNRYIPVRDMDVVHLLRSFKKLNEDAYINRQEPTKIGEKYYG
jgi:hypothetical protein